MPAPVTTAIGLAGISFFFLAYLDVSRCIIISGILISKCNTCHHGKLKCSPRGTTETVLGELKRV